MKENKVEKLFIANIECYTYFKKISSQYLSITGLFIGKVKIASYCMDGCNSKDDPHKWVVNSDLPTIKDEIGRYKTEDECKQICLKVAKVFCDQLKY